MASPHRCRRDDGMATVWTLGMILVVLFLGWVGFDLYLGFSERRDLATAADQAAQAGAAAMDVEHYRRTGEKRLDPELARRQALGHLEQHDLNGATPHVEATTGDVTVTLDGHVDLGLMSLLTDTGSMDVHVAAEGVPSQAASFVGSYRAPAGVTELEGCSTSWGGFQPGRIPRGSMYDSEYAGPMHPEAGVAYDAMADAAAGEGINLRGHSYRPAGESSGSSCSLHYWGLAVDIDVLASGDAGFDSPEYQWLAENAHEYGWSNPSWARPVEYGGTGAGGWAGGTCCHLEPWHWEWVAFRNG